MRLFINRCNRLFITDISLGFFDVAEEFSIMLDIDLSEYLDDAQISFVDGSRVGTIVAFYYNVPDKISIDVTESPISIASKEKYKATIKSLTKMICSHSQKKRNTF